MKFPFDKNTIITRLRVPYSGDQLAVRLRYASFFGGMDLHPASLPPNSVVCIRKLRDPQPRTLGLNRAGREFSDIWQDSVSREIEKLYRRAYRPINETVPAQAESIVFRDKAELLACLASDWCREILYQNWWWRSLFPNLDKAQTVARIWLESAEFAPQAFKIIAKKAIAPAFVNKLQPEETVELLKQIIETFGLKKLQNALFEPLTLKEKHTYKKIVEKEILSKKNSSGFSPPPDIWREYVPEIKFQVSTFEKEILIVVGLLLPRAPRIVRSEKFARQIREYKIEKELPPAKILKKTETITHPILKPEILKEEVEKKPTFRKEKKSRTDFSKRKVEAEKLSKKKPQIVFHDSETFEKESKKPSENLSGLKPGKQTKKTMRKTEEIRVEKSETEIALEDEKPEGKSKTFQTEGEKITPVISEDSIETIETEEFETIVRTKFGGVFYLLNLGLYLKLYRDFSEPSGDEIDLNIWDFAALLSREFLGKKIENDPVWNLLKQLAGREPNENFGEDFYPPDEWRIPTDWLKTFQTEKKWIWSKTKNRLIVRHSENFNVLDIPLEADFKIQLETELKNYRQYFSEIAEGKTQKLLKNLSPRQRFLNNLYEFAEHRLVQALNLEKRDELNKILFGQTATVAVSATHLEVTFSLADLPLAVRFSGLDRNPGWIPAAGKYVVFHFV